MLLELDAKGRVSLGKFLKSGTRVEATKKANGDLVLRPVVTIPEREMWLWKDKAQLKKLLKGIHSVNHTEIDFRQYAKSKD